LIRWPGRRPSFDGGSAAANCEIFTLVSSEISPVSDRLEHDVERHHLGQRGRVQPGIGIAECSTSPVRASITIAA
jgi:hypothetical protein